MKNVYSPAQIMRENEALYAKIAEQRATIDYLAMLAGIDLDENSSEVGDDEDEE